jgi:hypothetical protein
VPCRAAQQDSSPRLVRYQDGSGNPCLSDVGNSSAALDSSCSAASDKWRYWTGSPAGTFQLESVSRPGFCLALGNVVACNPSDLAQWFQAENVGGGAIKIHILSGGGACIVVVPPGMVQNNVCGFNTAWQIL